MDLFRRRPPVWALVLLPVLLWLGQYWQRGLWAPDEARYAYVAREMHQTGEWLVMHVNGDLYPDKPPLLFWLINVASVVTGGEINGISARLPSLLGMILALWAIARLAQRWSDAATAWRAVLVTMTAYLVWWEGGWGRIDALLLGLNMVALYQLFVFNDDGKRWRPLAAYTLLGLAMLAKGPVALAVVLGAYIAGTWANGERAKLKRWHWAWGLLLACGIAGLWLAAARWIGQGPDEYFQKMFGVKSFGRVTNAQDHANPFHYYLTHFPTEFLPWTVFLPAAYMALGAGALRRRVMGWGLFILVMFSLFSGKRQMYILGLYPAAALLVAAGWPRLNSLSRRWTGITGGIAVGLVLLLGVVGCMAPLAPHLVPEDSKPGIKLAKALVDMGGPGVLLRSLPGGLLMLGGGYWLLRLLRREGLSTRWFGWFAGVNFAHFALAGALAMPALNPVKAPLLLIPEAQARLAPDQPIHLYRHQLAIVPFYVDRPGRELRTPEEIEAMLQREKSGVIVLFSEFWHELAPRFGDRLLAHPLRIGSKEMVWAEFPKPAGAVQEEIALPRKKAPKAEDAE